jgi:hypothetical protein
VPTDAKKDDVLLMLLAQASLKLKEIASILSDAGYDDESNTAKIIERDIENLENELFWPALARGKRAH